MSTLITGTLPTVVGMGVVGRVAETALGRHRSKPSKGGETKPKSRKPKVYKGSRGGKYIMRKGRRVYV